MRINLEPSKLSYDRKIVNVSYAENHHLHLGLIDRERVVAFIGETRPDFYTCVIAELHKT